MDKYAHPEDCTIDRDSHAHGGMTVLYDSDGDVAFVVTSDWSDQQIMGALDIANSMYSAGIKVGESRKARAILRELGLTP